MRLATNQLLISIYRASDDNHQSAVGSNRKLRVAKVVALLADGGQCLPLHAILRVQDANLTLGVAVLIEYVSLALAESDVVLALELLDRGEGVVLTVIPDFVHRVGNLLRPSR